MGVSGSVTHVAPTPNSSLDCENVSSSNGRARDSVMFTPACSGIAGRTRAGSEVRSPTSLGTARMRVRTVKLSDSCSAAKPSISMAP